MEIKELIKKAHENASKKGFWEDWESIQNISYENREIAQQFINNAIGNRLMLIVSEVGEAQEGLRHKDMDNFKEELADIVIRVADLSGALEIDLENEIIKKMEKNSKRAYKHGKEF